MRSPKGRNESTEAARDDAPVIRRLADPASVDARAFTVGRDVVFGAGAYDPGSERGRQTMAHELTHVTQQRDASVAGSPQPGGLAVSDPGDRSEREAEAAAAGIGGPVSPASAPMISREPLGAPLLQRDPATTTD